MKHRHWPRNLRNLYAAGFARYAGDLLPGHGSAREVKGIALGLIAAMVVVNLVVGMSETFVIAVEVVILGAFVVIGPTKGDAGRLSESGGDGLIGVLFGAGLLYVTFEVFGIVTDSAAGMRKFGASASARRLTRPGRPSLPAFRG